MTKITAFGTAVVIIQLTCCNVLINSAKTTTKKLTVPAVATLSPPTTAAGAKRQNLINSYEEISYFANNKSTTATASAGAKSSTRKQRTTTSTTTPTTTTAIPSVTKFVEQAQSIMAQAISPLVVNKPGMMNKGLNINKLLYRPKLNDTMKERIRKAFNQVYEMRRTLTNESIQDMRKMNTNSDNDHQSLYKVLYLTDTTSNDDADDESCGDEIRNEACRLLEKHTNGSLFLLPYLIDYVAQQPNTGVYSPFMNVYDICKGKKATTYANAKTCINAGMLRAIGDFTDKYFTETRRPLYIKSLASGNLTKQPNPSVTHGYGTAVDILCIDFRSGSENNEAALCAKIIELCVKKAAELSLPYFPTYFPAEDHGCDRTSDFAITDSVHCTLGPLPESVFENGDDDIIAESTTGNEQSTPPESPASESSFIPRSNKQRP